MIKNRFLKTVSVAVASLTMVLVPMVPAKADEAVMNQAMTGAVPAVSVMTQAEAEEAAIEAARNQARLDEEAANAARLANIKETDAAVEAAQAEAQAREGISLSGPPTASMTAVTPNVIPPLYRVDVRETSSVLNAKRVDITVPMVMDLVIFAGQSNMSGAGGDVKKAPKVSIHTGLEYRNGKSSAGLYEIVEPFGLSATGLLSDPEGLKHGSLASSFINNYYASSGVPVVALAMSRGGTSVTYWNDPAVKLELKTKYNDAKMWCATHNITIRKQYVVWLQGETDASMNQAAYQAGLTGAFSEIMSLGVSQVFVITPGKLITSENAFDNVIAAQKNLCATNAGFTLATDALRNLPMSYLADGVHYNQEALNLVGAQAGAVAGKFSLTH